MIRIVGVHRMIAFDIFAVVVLVGLLWPAWTGVAVLIGLTVGFGSGAVLGALRRPARRLPTPRVSREVYGWNDRRWSLGAGIGVGFSGAFPFIYIRRRLR